MTDPKPLTPEEFETWKQEAKFPFGRRLAATIEAAWAERDALSKGLAVQMEASLRSAEALEDANARYTKAVTELQAEVAALKVQAEIDLATMKGKLLEVCDKVTSLIQERDKALADLEEMRRRVETAQYQASVVALGHATAEEMQDALAAWASRVIGARIVRLRRRLLKVIGAARVLKAERAEHQALIDLQHKRMVEATKHWCAESPKERELTWPDLGELLGWLMAKWDAASSDGARTREALTEYKQALQDHAGDRCQCPQAKGHELVCRGDCGPASAKKLLFILVNSPSPDDWLKRHDAEVRAQAFEEAATICEKSYKSTHPLGGPLHTVLLRDRAAQERAKEGEG